MIHYARFPVTFNLRLTIQYIVCNIIRSLVDYQPNLAVRPGQPPCSGRHLEWAGLQVMETQGTGMNYSLSV